MRIKPPTVIIHLESQVPEVRNVETMHVLGGCTIVHEMAQVMADETPKIYQELAIGQPFEQFRIDG